MGRHLIVFWVLCQRVVLDLADSTVLGLCDSAYGKQVKYPKNLQKSEDIRWIDLHNFYCFTGCGCKPRGCNDKVRARYLVLQEFGTKKNSQYYVLIRSLHLWPRLDLFDLPAKNYAKKIWSKGK
ncbi:MAG: hypothetical protein ACKO96_46685 [Flammeovirgaceae bacterium]